MIFPKKSGGTKAIGNMEHCELIMENLQIGQMLAKTGSWTLELGKEGKFFFSDEVCNILECAPETLEHSFDAFFAYVHPDDLEKVNAAFQRALEGKEYEIEYRIVTQSGREKHVLEKTKTLYDKEGKPEKLIGIIQDLTKQKMIELHLAMVNKNMLEAQTISGIGTWTYDVARNEFYGTEEMFRIFGVDETEFKNDFRSVVELVHPNDQAKIFDALEKHLAGHSCQIEFRIPQTDGTMKYVVGRAKPVFDENGSVAGIIGTVQDITETKNLQHRLEKSQIILSQAQELAHIGSWEYDIAKDRITWSEEARRIYGITAFYNTLQEFLEYVHPEDVSIIEELMQDPPDKPAVIEFRFIRPDGSVRHISEKVKFVYDNDKPVLVCGAIRDVTQRKLFQESLQTKQTELAKISKRHEALVKEATDVFEIIDPDGTITYISPAVEKVLRCKVEDRLGKKIYDFYDFKKAKRLARMVQHSLEHPRQVFTGTVIYTTPDNENIHIEYHMKNLLDDPDIEGIVINFSDITRKVALQRSLLHSSYHCEETGLPNIKHFREYLKVRCRMAKKKQNKFAVLILKVVGLDEIDYLLGDVIKQKLVRDIVYERLSPLLFTEKVFISRYSDDHFAIILKEPDAECFEIMANKLIDLFAPAFEVGKYQLDAAANIGIAVFPDDGDDPETLETMAKIALHRARQEGKNTFKFYSSDLDIQNYKESVLRNDLHLAVDRNQLLVQFQPIVDLRTDEIIAAEALVRWDHPEWGIVPPGEFIYLAEETGLITDIGSWVLKEVCREYKRLLDKGLPPIKMSINVSGMQFLETDFATKILNIIDEFQLDPHFLIIEITESILMRKMDKAVLEIRKLQSHGIEVALDDFGTGFSSLMYIKSMNIDILKIAGSFLEDVPENETNATIVKQTVDLARSLNLKTVIEGIETHDQLAFLRRCDCATGQGYIYSRPLPAEEFEEYLEKRSIQPAVVEESAASYRVNRRKYFRVSFNRLLEGRLTIAELYGRSVNVGNTKVLIKNIGPGGLCFLSTIRFPVDRHIVLRFTFELADENVEILGKPVWTRPLEDNLYEYGIEFAIDEIERQALTFILNQVQIRLKKDVLFDDPHFVSTSPSDYFKALAAR